MLLMKNPLRSCCLPSVSFSFSFVTVEFCCQLGNVSEGPVRICFAERRLWQGTFRALRVSVQLCSRRSYSCRTKTFSAAAWAHVLWNNWQKLTWHSRAKSSCAASIESCLEAKISWNQDKNKHMLLCDKKHFWGHRCSRIRRGKRKLSESAISSGHHSISVLISWQKRLQTELCLHSPITSSLWAALYPVVWPAAAAVVVAAAAAVAASALQSWAWFFSSVCVRAFSLLSSSSSFSPLFCCSSRTTSVCFFSSSSRSCCTWPTQQQTCVSAGTFGAALGQHAAEEQCSPSQRPEAASRAPPSAPAAPSRLF